MWLVGCRGVWLVGCLPYCQNVQEHARLISSVMGRECVAIPMSSLCLWSCVLGAEYSPVERTKAIFNQRIVIGCSLGKPSLDLPWFYRKFLWKVWYIQIKLLGLGVDVFYGMNCSFGHIESPPMLWMPELIKDHDVHWWCLDIFSSILHRIALILVDISETVFELYPGNFLNIHKVHM